jgi:Transcriptional antiterminator
MEIIKIINNNIVSSLDEKGRELVVMGKGLGFQSKVGQEIEESRIEKIFRMDTNAETRRLQDLLIDIPMNHVKLVNEIIEDAKSIIDRKMNRNIYITLIDHINYAIERFNQNINFKNPLIWEIKKYYAKEFEAGQKAVAKINECCNIQLTDDEAASIALHFVNAELGTDMPHTVDVTKIVQNIFKIVRYTYNMEFDESSISYERFITHLKFFALRLMTNSPHPDDDIELHEIIKNKYPREYQCSEKIKQYIETEYKFDVPPEEMTYLTIHIRRITSKASE